MPTELIEVVNASTWKSEGDENEAFAERRRRDTRARLMAFTLGDWFSVGVAQRRCDLKALTPRRGEAWRAWEIRVTPTSPHTRIFGGFLTSHDFVATAVHAKASFKGVGRLSQDNLALTAFNRADTLAKNRLLRMPAAPTAASLGGEINGYFDEAD